MTQKTIKFTLTLDEDVNWKLRHMAFVNKMTKADYAAHLIAKAMGKMNDPVI